MTKRSSQVTDRFFADRCEQQLASICEETYTLFNRLKIDSKEKLAEIRERLMDVDRPLSNEISWVADDILKCEVRLEMVRWFESMTGPTADNPRSSWEAVVYIYRDLQERLVSQSSYGGMDLRSFSTEPVSNAMSHYRVSAISSVIRHDLSFVKFYAKQLGVNLFFDAEN